MNAEACRATTAGGSRPWHGSLPSLALLIGCLVAVLLLGAPVPNPRLTSDLKSEQGELSWEAVTLDAIATDARFGVDVVYTFGPLADVYIDQYHPAVWPRARLAKLVLLLLLGTHAWFLTAISPGPAWRRGLACLALVLPASQMNNDMMPDGVFIAAAVLAQLVYVARPRWRRMPSVRSSARTCAWRSSVSRRCTASPCSCR